jgi:DNA-binding CsgD family transcriptional regulator/tetratricopeptide (TPR) repeat protein
LVGRDDEIVRLQRLVVDVLGGRGQSVWVEGEPGIGKSALLATGLATADTSACHVFWVAADEVAQMFPLRALADSLRSATGAAGAAWQEIAGLLRGEGAGAVATPADAAAMAAERLVDVVERMCAGSPVLLVADDLQWADELSLSVWWRLHKLAGQIPLLLVGACRPVPSRAEVAALRRNLAEDHVVMVELAPLVPAHVAEMVRRLVGATPGPALLRQADLAGGNPLYVRELVDALVRERAVRVHAGVAEVVDPAAAAAPRSLAGAISGRLGFLSEQSVQVLRVAALLGAEFSVEDLTIITGRPATDLAPILHEATAAGVVAEVGAGLMFRHGLIRQALHDAMPSSLRSALHRQAAQALATAGMPVDRVAGQLLAGPQVLDGWVVDWVADSAAALTYRAPQIALDLLTRVRAAVAAEDPRRERMDASLATALLMLARYDQVEPVARQVLAVTSDPQVAGRMTWTLAYALHRIARHEAALEVLDEALRDMASPDVWRARVRALRALVLVSRDLPDEAETAASQAEAEAVRVGDRFAVGFALHALSHVQHRRGNDHAALEAIERALTAIGDEPETTDLRLQLLGNRVATLAHVGRPLEVDRAIGEALLQAEQAGYPALLASMRLHAADHWRSIGRWDDALAELAAADELPLSPARRLWRRGLGALIASHRDDRAALRQHVHAVEDLDLSVGDLHYHSKDLLAARAIEAERDGQPEQALALLLSAVDMIYPWTGGQQARGDVYLPDTVRLALAVGDISVARGVTEAADALAERDHGPFLVAAAQHCGGLLAANPTLVLAAADGYNTLNFPLGRAKALEDAAVQLAQQGRLPPARSAYADAVDIYTALDAAWDIRRANARLRPLGLHRGARGPRRRPATGWEALTPSELTIARQVADGRSNSDIAADLFLSRRTVQTHVSHILTKLGARSRIDIARAALSRD